jgi:hypothetical protein
MQVPFRNRIENEAVRPGPYNVILTVCANKDK